MNKKIHLHFWCNPHIFVRINEYQEGECGTAIKRLSSDVTRLCGEDWPARASCGWPRPPSCPAPQSPPWCHGSASGAACSAPSLGSRCCCAGLAPPSASPRSPSDVLRGSAEETETETQSKIRHFYKVSHISVMEQWNIQPHFLHKRSLKCFLQSYSLVL